MAEPFALGRHVQHDPASRGFMARMVSIPRTVLWAHNAPVLNQGNIGSCTGQAMAQCLNTEKFNSSRKGAYLTEDDAIGLYSTASFLDNIEGGYLPTDTGSTGLAVAKAAQQRGFITSYSHAFGFDQMIASLQASPVIVGTNWYKSFYEPDSKGVITFDGGTAMGGHEYLVLGVDMEEKFVTCLNSWGPEWSTQGRFRVSFEDFTRLLSEDGDVCVPTPLA